MESVPSTVAPRAERRLTPPNAVMEGRRLHVRVPRNDVVQENARVPVEITAFAPKAIVASLFEEFPDVL